MLTTIFDDAAGLSAHAATRIRDLLSATLSRRGMCVLALSGGTTPGPSYRRLSAMAVDWSRVQILQTDERISGEKAATAAAAIEQDLIEPAGVPSDNWHPMPHDGVGLDAAIDRYASLFRRLCPTGSPDVAVLGLGDDGHTASLFGNEPAESEPVLRTGPYGGTERISLSAVALRRAEARLMLVSGSGKASAVKALAVADPLDATPAVRIMFRHGELLVDRDAAADLAGPSDTARHLR